MNKTLLKLMLWSLLLPGSFSFASIFNSESCQIGPAQPTNAYLRIVRKQQAPSIQSLEMTSKLIAFANQNIDLVAVVSRAGSNLTDRTFARPSRQKFTHAGFLVHDLNSGGWLFIHLLNDCNSSTSRIYQQTVSEFFTDSPYYNDILITVPSNDLQRKIHNVLMDKAWALKLFDSRYSKIANPFAFEFQNSNMWILSVIAAAQSGLRDRLSTQFFYQSHGFQPSQINIKFYENFAAPFMKNVAISDHTLDEIKSGWWNFASAASVHVYLRNSDAPNVDSIELCPNQGCNLPLSK